MQSKTQLISSRVSLKQIIMSDNTEPQQAKGQR